jgi:hypothetical protein
MKQFINEAKRMQQLAGIINENESSKSELEPIKDDLSNLKPKDFLESNSGYVALYMGASPTTGKHKVVFDVDGSRGTYTKDNLIKIFKVYKNK